MQYSRRKILIETLSPAAALLGVLIKQNEKKFSFNIIDSHALFAEKTRNIVMPDCYAYISLLFKHSEFKESIFEEAYNRGINKNLFWNPDGLAGLGDNKWMLHSISWQLNDFYFPLGLISFEINYKNYELYYKHKSITDFIEEQVSLLRSIIRECLISIKNES